MIWILTSAKTYLVGSCLTACLSFSAAREFRVAQKGSGSGVARRTDRLVDAKKKKSRKRLGGAGRKMIDGDMEEALFDWIGEMRANNLRDQSKG